jgi:hypothetical protein
MAARARRLSGMLNAAQVETCSEPLLRAGKDARARWLSPIHTHAGGNLIEFERIMEEHRKTPVQSSPTSASSTSARSSATPSSPPRIRGRSYPVRRRSRDSGRDRATVGHCPYKYAKMAMTLAFRSPLSRGRA